MKSKKVDLTYPVEDLMYIGDRCSDILAKNHIRTVEDLIQTTPDTLITLKGIGPKSILNIRKGLKIAGVIQTIW